MSDQNNRKALKSGIWYTVCNFLVKSIGFITTPIFTRLLTKTEFGIYNNYISWLSILTILITLNLDSTLISARYDFEKEFDRYIFSMLSLSTLSVLLWLSVINLFSPVFTELFGLEIRYINAMLVYLLALPAVNLFQARERYYFEYKKSVAASMILSIGTAFLSVLLVTTLPDRLAGRIYGSIIPTVLLGAGFYLYFLKKAGGIKLAFWRYALPICLPFIPHLLSLTLLNSIDRVMITKICGAEQNALYSLAYTCGTIVNLLMVSLNSAFAPWLGEKLSKHEYSEIKNFSKVYMSGFFLLAIGMMLVAPEVLLIMGGKSYMEAMYVMTPVAMGCVCQFLYTMFVNVEQFEKKTIGMAIASMLAAAINFGLNSIFIPKFGYLAAAYTTLTGYICLLLMHMYLVKRIRLNEIYSYRFVGILVLAGMALMCMITLSYGSWIRYGLIIVYSGLMLYLLWNNRQLLKQFVRNRNGKR